MDPQSSFKLFLTVFVPRDEHPRGRISPLIFLGEGASLCLSIFLKKRRQGQLPSVGPFYRLSLCGRRGAAPRGVVGAGRGRQCDSPTLIAPGQEERFSKWVPWDTDPRACF